LPSEQDELKYTDWAKLVSGLMHDTPLGHIVEIRTQKDKNVLKQYGAYEKRIRSDWQKFLRTKSKGQADIMGDISFLQAGLKASFGKGT